MCGRTNLEQTVDNAQQKAVTDRAALRRLGDSENAVQELLVHLFFEPLVRKSL